MTPNLSGAIGFRWSIAAVFALWVCAPSAPAQPVQVAKTNSITGVYNGTYAGDQGPIKFKLSITQQDNGSGILAGVFTLYLPEGSDTKAYTCDLSGSLRANRTFLLKPGKWETPKPSGFEMAPGMNGLFNPAAGKISGTMRNRSGPNFQAIRDADESAKLASAPAEKKDAEAPASPAARAERKSAAAARVNSPRPKPAAPAQPSSPAAVSGFSWRTASNGVYTGTFGTNADDKVPAKLYVKFIENGSVDGILDGLFTFDVPPFPAPPGAKPITYTYKLIGRPQARGAGFHSAKPLGKPAPDAYAVTQLGVEFVRSLVKGGNGQLESSYNPDQISGKVSGSNGLPGNLFEAVRDKDESANVDSLMAAAEASAASAVSTTAPAAAIAGAPAPAPGAPVVRPGMLPQGVFNGTYTRENEPPTKFKLTITRSNDNLGGMAAGTATIYLPTDSGTKAYTYSLLGHYSERDFTLTVQDWETIPPKDFKHFKGMGFNGRFLSNMNQNTARIISVRESGANASMWDGLVVPQFEAKWDATESADIKGAIAAQKAVGDADQIAAVKAQADVLKNAKPKQLASKDLVRKSQAYWKDYRSDFIREIFDGGFADDVDRDPAFQSLFVDYVDLFSKNCAAYFPGAHKSVTITTVTTTTHAGGAVDTETTSKTVEVDSRFIPKYVEFSGVDPAPGSEQEKEQTAKTIAIAGQIFHRGGPSHGVGFADANASLHLLAAHGVSGGFEMGKFFATEVKATGPSAALRQMGENLLRGATGDPSLQEAGAKIDGAQAETDKDLPPGRFARFIDAAHAFYSDPANARLKSRFQTAFDETLAAKYRGVMTPQEEYYYANDFETRFRGQIMQPRDRCTDPAWPRLHPAVEECVVEISD
jgi:hypothetical protein